MAGDVELQDVTKAFGDFRAVDAVSLAIRAGDFVALLGPSGAGKSTVLRMIGGFELPDGGSIRIGGRDVTDLPPYRRDVNTVFQNYALFPHMSVAENVAYGLRQDQVPRRDCRSFSSSCISSRSCRSSAPSGSSSSSTDGRFTSARARATRCCWPPDSCVGLRCANWSICIISSASRTRFWRSRLGTWSCRRP